MILLSLDKIPVLYQQLGLTDSHKMRHFLKYYYFKGSFFLKNDNPSEFMGGVGQVEQATVRVKCRVREQHNQ